MSRTCILCTMVYSTSGCHATVARDYRESERDFICFAYIALYSRPLNHIWVENHVCFKGELLLLIICDGGSSLHLYMADKHPTLCMVDSDEQFLNEHGFGCKIVRAWSSLLSRLYLVWGPDLVMH